MRGRSVTAAQTANAIDGMVRALMARDGATPANGARWDGQSTNVQMQDGTLWSVSGVDRVLASLAARENGQPARRFDEAAGSADLTHAQLINAMAAFGTSSGLNVSFPPEAPSPVEAMTLAIRSH